MTFDQLSESLDSNMSVSTLNSKLALEFSVLEPVGYNTFPTPKRLLTPQLVGNHYHRNINTLNFFIL